MFFVENYIPLLDDQGKVLAMVEIYKEPVDLFERLERGRRLIWAATALVGWQSTSVCSGSCGERRDC
jgi:two-component system sensor histidine kinase HydH